MKKFMMTLACVLACFSLFTGYTNQKDSADQDTNFGGTLWKSIDTDIAINTKLGLDTGGNPDDVTSYLAALFMVPANGLYDYYFFNLS